MKDRPASLYAQLALCVAFSVFMLKGGAWWLTGSVGLFSDALESLVNIFSSALAWLALYLASLPSDEHYPYGRDKIEYFCSGVIAGMVLATSAGIAWAAIDRLFEAAPIVQIQLGSVLALLATLLNASLAWVLHRAGQRLRSVSLQADAVHLGVDVKTTIGVLVGVWLAYWSEIYWLDPLVALLVAVMIAIEGYELARSAVDGLLDASLPQDDLQQIHKVLDKFRENNDGDVRFHALRTRAAGRRRFINLHVLVPGYWSVDRGHTLLEEIEKELLEYLPHSTMSTHLEPIESPNSYMDMGLDRRWL